ncbi:multicopper oxidase domain-containing protein [Timonella sp. A28]|uniref:multicopper oxidase domain-containing protein n=1 Tax=Timonella sp. A28 TaxID=3442640 RepID=UPI003EB72AFC
MIPTSAPPTPVKKFWFMRDIPAFIWILCALATTLFNQWLPEARWLIFHFLLLGAATHSIMVWSQHFSHALLHSPASIHERTRQNIRLIALNCGIVCAIVGVLSTFLTVTIIGATLVVLSVMWHAISLLSRLKKALGVRFGITIKYYIAASACLPVGVTLGVLLSHGYADPLHGQLRLAHIFINIFGWIGLTIVGTLVTLWPTMLRTKIDDQATAVALRVLPILISGIIMCSGGALGGVTWLVVCGLVLYMTGLIWLGFIFLRTALRKTPQDFPTLSVATSYVWLVGSLIVLLVHAGTAAFSATSWDRIFAGFTTITPFLAAGFVLQTLLGALAYLIPVVLSSGPQSARATHTEMNRGAILRVVTANLALLVCALPVTATIQVSAAFVYVASTSSFIIFMVRSMKTAKRIRVSTRSTNKHDNNPTGEPLRRLPPPNPAHNTNDAHSRGTIAGQAILGLVVVIVAVLVGVALQPDSLRTYPIANGASQSSEAVAQHRNAPHKTVRVEAKNMRFFPESINVPHGTNLTIELVNTDSSEVHDLVLSNGRVSARIMPGDSTQIEVGVITQSLDGWCSIIGHKQMGMVFAINVLEPDDTTQTSGETPPSEHAHTHMSKGNTDLSAAQDLDFMAQPSKDFKAYDATLKPLSPREGSAPQLHKFTFEVEEKVMEVAPGVRQEIWTFDGSFPGPTLHGRVGDTFEITLVNNGSMGHSIDFHASLIAPDQAMRTIAPGESLVYRFVAERAGIWMYHCSTMPMTAHIANGMFGAVVIEPDDLPEVDKSYVIVQNEMYLGKQDEPVDVTKALTGDSALDLVVFNGYANQYAARPLTAQVGERVRVWMLVAGPSRASSFHVVGSQFDRVWFEGNYLLGSAQQPATGGTGGSQALGLQPAQGGFVELTFPEPGNYPFVTHIMVDAERGAKGIFTVTQ